MSETSTEDLFDFSEDENKVFEAAEVREQGKFVDPPDGKYVVKVAKAFMDKSKSDSVKKFNMHLTIVNGKYKGKMLFINNRLGNETGIKVLKQTLANCGITLVKLSDLKDHMEDLLDKLLDVQKKTQKDNDKFYNVYINGVVEESEVTDSEPAVAGQDLPF